MVASPSYCVIALPPFGIYSDFLLVLPLVRLVKMAFFFFCFFLLETILRGRNALPTNNVLLSKQRFVLIVIDFLNQFPEFLKMVFDDVIQIRINRQFVNPHNTCKPVKRFVVFLPYIH